ncbi:hypothetical protein N7530_000125 [Penicillium desertorum]|uniref:Uncharacterized protein n=1 Tax=Penicillium desertorum TaxID=1303715 RepID=A0A9W9X7L6_9EURO|nr:hypothetical protein N7530_000125 [Penicillium desertorum]
MCLSVPPSSLALISLTGFLANLDPYPSLLNSPSPDISLPAHPVLSPFALAFDFSASEVTWLGVPDRYSEYLATILYDRSQLSTLRLLPALTPKSGTFCFTPQSYHR